MDMRMDTNIINNIKKCIEEINNITATCENNNEPNYSLSEIHDIIMNAQFLNMYWRQLVKKMLQDSDLKSNLIGVNDINAY